MPIVLRIGRNGSIVDNAHAGGLFIYISDDGILSKYAFSEKQDRFDRHPNSGVIFKNYKIDFITQLLNCSKKMHLNTPQLGVISWDLTIDENEKIVLIEANTRGQSIWFPQMSSGKPAFGDNTEKMLQIISKRRKHYD